AVTRSWMNTDGERREETEWFNVVAWGKLAEVCKSRITRSQQVYVEGRLQTRGWEDSDGRKHFRTEVVARDVILLGEQGANGTDDYETAYDGDDDEYAF
ncbi:MAG: single-stranded DNA-binding protein, partial [Chloroflexota bacterium]